jgi:hypothetical protein
MASRVEKSPNGEPGYRRLAAHWRVILSVVLLIHLTAVIAAPWSGPDGASPVASAVVRPFGPYLDAAYLGHGYRFFAPEPGPGHFIRYELELADGKSQAGTFPDLKTERPRLFYHRHFMLTEKLDGFRLRGELPADAPSEAKQAWEAERNLFNTIARSYANHLLHESGARKVKLQLVEHNLPVPARVAEGQKLTDPQLYQVVWTGTFEADPS